MDWTPSQKPLPPATPRVTYFGHSQPSPFYGRLPPAPVSQAHKLRNPPNQPTFRKASTPQKQTAFKRPSAYLDQDDISEAGSEITATTIDPSEYASPGFAHPKFFPNSDYLKDTGLESIFSKTFSIAEEPHEVRVARELQEPFMLQQNPQNGKTRAFFSVILALSCSVWSYSFIIPDVPNRFRYACLIIAVIVTAYGIIQGIKKPKKDIIWGYVSVYGFELCVATFLFGAINTHSTGVVMSGPGAQGFALLGLMALQELYILYIGSRSTQVRSTGKAPSTQDSASSPPNQDEPTRNREISSSSSRTTISQRTPVPSSERTTRSKSRLEKSAGVSPGLDNLSLGDGGLSGTQYPRTKRKW